MVRSTLLQVAPGGQIAKVPKCHISRFHAKFGHVFLSYHIEKCHRAQTCHLGKLEQHVRSPWITRGALDRKIVVEKMRIAVSNMRK